MSKITLLDGGMGRELHRIGAPFRQPEWSALALMEAPSLVQVVHQSFLNAGADVITTNSYAVVPFHIGEARFHAEGRQLAALAGQLARQAAAQAGRPAKVAGSLPPTGGSYRPDLFDVDQAQTVLSTLIEGLSPHVDLWLAETQSRTDEVRAVRRALGDDDRPLWISFTLKDDDVEPGEPQLRSGEPVADATAAAVEAGASALLFNCSQPEVMSAALDAARSTLARLSVDIPVGLYANAFPPQREDAQANEDLDTLRADLDPDGYSRWGRQWLDQGAEIIGGCCGIGPAHIARLRQLIDA